jgi:hypothetical protein
MTRTRGSASKDLGRRAFGTVGRWKTPGKAAEKSGEVIDPGEEILHNPVVPPVSRAWKPRAGRIYNFPVRTVVEEK